MKGKKKVYVNTVQNRTIYLNQELAACKKLFHDSVIPLT